MSAGTSRDAVVLPDRADRAGLSADRGIRLVWAEAALEIAAEYPFASHNAVEVWPVLHEAVPER